MRKTFYLLLTLVFLSSCAASYKPIVGLYLSDVNGKENSGMSYIDDIIAIDWSYVYKSKLNFKLKNVSAGNIKILWDGVAYVNPSGSTVRVMHAGVKYADRNESQPPTVIPSNSFVDDVIIPTSVVSYSAYVGWTEGSLFSVSSNRKLAEQQLNNTYGRSIKVIMPIEVGDKTIDYTFTFTVTKL